MKLGIGSITAVAAVIIAVTYLLPHNRPALPPPQTAIAQEAPTKPAEPAANQDAVAVANYRSQLAFPIDGIVAEIRVREGQRVKTGQVLMQLDTSQIGLLLSRARQHMEDKIGIRQAELELKTAKMNA